MRRAAVAAGPLVVVLSIAVPAPAPALASSGDPADMIVVGTEGAYPPWNITRPDGSLDGFEPELLTALCAKQGLHCRLVAQDWDGMIAALQAHKIDVIADALEITADRRAVLDYTLPYAVTPAVFVTQTDNPLATMPGRGRTIDLDGDVAARSGMLSTLRVALRGRSIGIELSGVFGPFLQRELGGVLTIRQYRTTGERDLDLLAGRIDLTLEDASYVRPLLAAPDTATLTLAGPAFTGGELGGGEALAVRKGDTALAARLDAGIRAAAASGLIRRLSLKWLKMDASP